MGLSKQNVIWSDRKHYFGLPLSFTKYAISEDRLFQQTGILNLKYEEILLYRVRDITLNRSFGERIFGVGTIVVFSSDKSRSELVIESVKNPVAVKELLHQQVEAMKISRRVRFGDFAVFSDDIEDQLDGEA